MAFFVAKDGKRYASRKAYAASLLRQQRREENHAKRPLTVDIPQYENPPRMPARLPYAPIEMRFAARLPNRAEIATRRFRASVAPSLIKG